MDVTAESALARASPPPLEQQRQLQRSSLPSRPNATSRHLKRLTLNFPISIPQPLNSQLQSDRSSPSPSITDPVTQSSLIPSPSRSSTSTPALNDAASDGYDFLTTLAAQERKVLELKEELQKAETELATLKRQWAMGEKGRKRTEIVHHAEVLKPLKHPQATTPAEPD